MSVSVVSVGAPKSKELVVYDPLAPVCDVAMFAETVPHDRGFMCFPLMLAMVSFLLGVALGRSLAKPSKQRPSTSERVQEKKTVHATPKDKKEPPKFWVTATGGCYHTANCRCLTDSRREVKACLVCKPTVK